MFGGRFTLRRKIGAGGMGEVWQTTEQKCVSTRQESGTTGRVWSGVVVGVRVPGRAAARTGSACFRRGVTITMGSGSVRCRRTVEISLS